MGGGPTHSSDHVRQLASEERSREAAVFLLSQLGQKAWLDLTPDDLQLLDAFCEHALGGLLQRDVAWLIRSPSFLSRLTQLVEAAAGAGHRAAASVERLARLRCLMAMSEATRGRLERAHELFCSAAGRPSKDMPPPNGRLHEDVTSLGPPHLAAADFLKGFFRAYFAFLRRIGENELANVLESSAQDLAVQVEQEEHRPGVVRALFYNREEDKGYVRLVHASVEASPEGKEEMRYLPLEKQRVEESMVKAAEVAWRAADHYLTTHGYPDGLTARKVRWQLTTATGDPVQATARYEGGSIGLPLALAILSSYVDQPVPCHVAMTGALDPWAVEGGSTNRVDGVPQKLLTAVQAGYKKAYVPAANAEDLAKDLALENRARQAGCTIVPVAAVADVCRDTFNEERDGSFFNVLADGWRELSSLLGGPGTSKQSALQTYRWHVTFSALLFAALFLLEGSVAHLGLSAQQTTLGGWALVVLSAIVAFLLVPWCYALACAGLKNRKKWPWFLSAGILGLGAAVALLLLSPVVPAATDISSAVDAFPIWGIGKDLFFFWLFGWGILANTFCAVAALTYLAQRGQFLTLRRSLRWQSPMEAALPLRCFVFPWEWGALALLVAAIVLGFLEIRYFFSLRTDLPEAAWAVTLLMTRDIVFILAVVECLVFYKQGLADARQALA